MDASKVGGTTTCAGCVRANKGLSAPHALGGVLGHLTATCGASDTLQTHHFTTRSHPPFFHVPTRIRML